MLVRDLIMSSHYTLVLKKEADPGYLKQDVNLGEGALTYIFYNVCTKKLHENENNWAEMEYVASTLLCWISHYTQISSYIFEFSHNTQSWQHWHLIQMHQKYSRKEKEVIFSQNPNRIYTRLFWGKMISFVYNTLGFSEKITSFSFFKYFDAFELDVNVVNFVHYGKTRLRDS